MEAAGGINFRKGDAGLNRSKCRLFMRQRTLSPDDPCDGKTHHYWQLLKVAKSLRRMTLSQELLSLSSLGGSWVDALQHHCWLGCADLGVFCIGKYLAMTVRVKTTLFSKSPSSLRFDTITL